MSDITSDVPLASQPVGAFAPTRSADHPWTPPLRQPGLRLWPAVVIIALQWAVTQGAKFFSSEPMVQFMAMLNGPMVGMLALVIWWLFFSRIRWFDRCLGLVGLAVTCTIAFLLSDPSLRPMPFPMPWIMNALPTAATAWVVWLVVTPRLRLPIRVGGLWLVLLAAWGYWDLLRFDGVTGSFASEWNWRWASTPEQKFLASRTTQGSPEGKPARFGGEPLVLQPGDWPGFRGPARDGRLTGVRILTNWQESPPEKLWRQRVGPGWSSFAVVGSRVYTQEQRGEDEVVVCYHSDTGSELWVHNDAERFTEAVAGPGPRATPTFHEGKIYALGAKGKLNCLDAETGKALWTKDIMEDSGAKVPTWGFSASPLVVKGVVTVFAGGPDKSVLGYDAATGKLVWSAGDEEFSYCSLHPVTLAGVEQIVIANDQGLTSFDPSTGKILWRHKHPLDKGMARCVQPTVVSDSDLLVGFGFSKGTQRVHISRQKEEWTTEEVWDSRAINPYYNDLVIHKGYLYGFDGSNFFTCVNLEDGKSKWRARGYGNGQVLLLADQDLLLILTEKGEVALVEATPDKHTELTRFQAIEGKTWNHPVVANGKLFVRNGEEAACYKLPVKK